MLQSPRGGSRSRCEALYKRTAGYGFVESSCKGPSTVPEYCWSSTLYKEQIMRIQLVLGTGAFTGALESENNPAKTTKDLQPSHAVFQWI
jgi:hypothetical protein